MPERMPTVLRWLPCLPSDHHFEAHTQASHSFEICEYSGISSVTVAQLAPWKGCGIWYAGFYQ